MMRSTILASFYEGLDFPGEIRSTVLDMRIKSSFISTLVLIKIPKLHLKELSNTLGNRDKHE
jgi:hypothetical protein